MLQLEAYLHSASFKGEDYVEPYENTVHRSHPFLAGVIVVSAESREVIQNERGTFIQDQSGAWHQYNRIRHVIAPLPVFAQAPGGPAAFRFNDNPTAIGGMASGGGNLVPLW